MMLAMVLLVQQMPVTLATDEEMTATEQIVDSTEYIPVEELSDEASVLEDIGAISAVQIEEETELLEVEELSEEEFVIDNSEEEENFESTVTDMSYDVTYDTRKRD